MEEQSKSIIGKKYIPQDNSYSVNLTSSSGYPYKNDFTTYLAGALFQDHTPKVCTILTEPFECAVTGLDKIKLEIMIIVEYNNTTHMTMYFEQGIVEDNIT